MSEYGPTSKAAQWQFFDDIKHSVSGGTCRYFLQTLVRYANEDNTCWRTITTFAEDMGVGEKTVRRSIKQLEELGVIFVLRKRTQNGKSHPNVYMLNLQTPLLDAVRETASREKGRFDTVIETDTVCNHTDSVTDTVQNNTVTVTATKENESFDAVTMTAACEQVGDKNEDSEGRYGHSVHLMRSLSPFDAVTVTDKYKVNINKNINTGVASENSLDNTQQENFIFDISETDVLNFWTYIKGFAKRNYNRKLSATPNKADRDAIQWAIEEFGIDAHAKEDCLSLCEFVHQELGQPDKVFNPTLRLQMAAAAHPQGTSRFFEKYIESSFIV